MGPAPGVLPLLLAYVSTLEIRAQAKRAASGIASTHKLRVSRAFRSPAIQLQVPRGGKGERSVVGNSKGRRHRSQELGKGQDRQGYERDEWKDSLNESGADLRAI